MKINKEGIALTVFYTIFLVGNLVMLAHRLNEVLKEPNTTMIDFWFVIIHVIGLFVALYGLKLELEN